MSRICAIVVLAGLWPQLASAAPRYIGPWFVEQTVDRITGQVVSTAGQNSTTLGITFTCFDGGLTLGVWRAEGSLGLEIARKVTVAVQVDALPAMTLVGVGTRRNLAEFEQAERVAQQFLAGRQAQVVFADRDGREVGEIFRLDNTAIAFSALGGCPIR